MPLKTSIKVYHAYNPNYMDLLFFWGGGIVPIFGASAADAAGVVFRDAPFLHHTMNVTHLIA